MELTNESLAAGLCLQCADSEGWGPFSRYFDITPCFLYGVLFNGLNVATIFAGISGIYNLLFRNSLSIYDSLYRFDVFAVTRLALIIAQVVFKFVLLMLDNGQYYLRSELVQFLSIFEIASLFAIVLPLTYLDFKKLRTCSSFLLSYWAIAVLFTFFKLVNIVIRRQYQADSDLTVTATNVSVTAITFVNGVIILLCQAVPKTLMPLTTFSTLSRFLNDKKNPLDTANLFSILTFNWMSGLMKLGYKKFLTLGDLPRLPETFDNKSVTTNLQEVYHQEKQKNSKTSLAKIMLKSYRKPLGTAAFFKAIQDVLQFVQPQLLKTLIKFVNDYNRLEGDKRPPLVRGFNIAFAMLLVSVFQTAALNQYFFKSYSTGIKIKSALIGAIYEKSLVLSPESRNVKSTSDIVNLMSIDTQRLQDLTEYGQIIWSGPFQIIICLISLYRLLNNSMWFGFSIMVVMIAVNTSLMKYQKTLQKKQMLFKDSRIKIVSEILNNIRSLKLYSWEIPYKEKLDYWRNNKELTNLVHISIFKAINMAMWNMIPFFVSCSTFFGYIYFYDEPLTTDIVFPALALFNLLGFPLNVIPMVITAFIDANVSVNRLNDFLELDELDQNAVIRTSKVRNIGDVVVEFDDCSFSWNKRQYTDAHTDYLALKNINFTATKGELSCIIGKVGAGKSSFVKSMLGDLYKYHGSLTIHGKVAYVSQVAWIMNGTIKDNILFGHKYDALLYKKVIRACDLDIDLKNFLNGDVTQVGEKGISLSGGQKARLSLARAIYSGADLYMLDDPLAAVDEHVGKHLIDNVFGEKGLLRHKCKILVTNSVHFLNIADNITLLEDGVITEQSNYNKLETLSDKEKESSKIYQLIQQFGKKKADGDSSDTPTVADNVSEASSEVKVFEGHIEDDVSISNDVDGGSLRRASTVTLGDTTIAYDEEDGKDKTREERLERGKVKWNIYLQYARACNPKFVVIFMVFAVGSMFFNVAANYWLKDWSEVNSRYGYNPNVGKYLFVYVLLGFTGSMFLLIQSITLWNYCIIHGARTLHDKMANAVMRAPMSFFETTPIGRILNRFSNDVNKVDEVLGRTFQSFFQNVIKVIFTMIVIFFSTWQIILIIIPLGFLYYYYQQYYLKTSRELKRLESITRSPIYAHFQETLNGITTIRGYEHEKRFIKLNEIKVDNNLGAYHPTVNSNRWLAVRLEFLGSLIIFSSATFAIFGLQNGTVTAGLVGLSVSYALQITGSLNWIVRMTVEVETNIVSVERIEEYSTLKSEAPTHIEETKPPADWPSQGQIEFRDYSTRYREDLELVLKNISFTVQPQEKIGIVGRTGAGKSSLTMALFRIIEPSEGEILIDGVSTSSVGLGDLRSKLSIIPQDAQVFEGTIRDNLDPTNQYKDENIWKAIELSHLKDHIIKMAEEQNSLAKDNSLKVVDYLQVKVTENGSNLSVGQKQLMCLARAILIPSKILVLDEATAAVDVETDQIVQKTIRSEFSDRTILTIAHRINTIMDSDRILVLEKGEVAEFDTPEKLLENPESIFYSLAKQGGLVN